MFILKQLRRKKRLNQTNLAQAIGVSLRTIQLYEKKDANIPIKNLTKIAQYFDVSIAELYSHEVNEEMGIYSIQEQIPKKGYAIKAIGSDKFLVTVCLVAKENHDEYVLNFDSPTFLNKLPLISFVLEKVEEGNYISFEIVGNSMDNGSIDGIPDGAIILGKQISTVKLKTILENNQQVIWVIVYKDAILCKEIVGYDEKTKVVTCRSLNTALEYSDFQIDSSDVVQFFKVVKKQIN